MHYRTVIFCLLLAFTSTVFAQGGMIERPPVNHKLGLEFQAYPAGLMPGISYALGIGADHEFHLRAGMNFAKRNDWGVQLDERGSGYGVTMGYRYRFQLWNELFSIGPRCDIWDMDINFIDTRVMAPWVVRSETEILVVQPTLELAWWKRFGDSPFEMGLSLSNGYEINVRTRGLPVGEGFITLVGLNARVLLNR